MLYNLQSTVQNENVGPPCTVKSKALAGVVQVVRESFHIPEGGVFNHQLEHEQVFLSLPPFLFPSLRFSKIRCCYFLST